MDILPKKQKIFYTMLVAIEIIIVGLFKGGVGILLLCIVCNGFTFGINSWKFTGKFVELLRSENPLIYHKHQWAMDSGNILTIKIALRKEVLNDKESKTMKLALKYTHTPFIIAFSLILIFIIRNFY